MDALAREVELAGSTPTRRRALPGQLTHTFATELLSADIDMHVVVQRRLGHGHIASVVQATRPAFNDLRCAFTDLLTPPERSGTREAHTPGDTGGGVHGSASLS